MTTFYTEEKDTIRAFCVKCQEKREIQNPEEVTLKNGRKALRGVCPDCGTKMFKFISSKKEND